jgi:hypothetical protein
MIKLEICLLAIVAILVLVAPVKAIVGDVNGDGKVNLADVYAVASGFGTHIGEAGYKPNLDLNGDGKVDLIDYFIVCSNFGK